MINQELISNVLVSLRCANTVFYCANLNLNVFNYGFRVNDVSFS